ncbi:MAG: hypothetical protein ACTH2U_12165 [Brevibacterium sp.]
MVGDLIRLKLALTRNAITGTRAIWAWTGAIVGATIAACVVGLAAWPPQPATIVPDLLAIAYLTWLIGWVVGPVMAPAPPLRSAHLMMLPLPRYQLATGLLVAGFVGLSTAVTVLLFASLAVHATHLGVIPALLSVPLAALQVALLVLLSRVVHVGFGRLARARAGAALGGVLLACILVLSQSGWVVFAALASSGVLENGFPQSFSAVLRWAPSGWALAAVEAAAAGSWALMATISAIMLALAAILLFVWGTSLGEARGARALVRGKSGRRSARSALMRKPTSALVLKELRSWWRDPARSGALSAPLAWGVLTAILPLSFGAVELLPWAGVLIAIMASTWLANIYAFDGTAIWLTLQTGTERKDVRARQWAYLLVFAPISLLITVGFTLCSGLDWAWPWALSALTAALGGGAGLIAYTSVAMPTAGTDARQRVQSPEGGTEEIGAAFLVFFTALVPPLPALGIVALGALQGNAALQWTGVLVGSMIAVLLTWGLGRLAAGRLERTGPEILLLLRTGRHEADAHCPESTGDCESTVTGRDMVIVTVALVLGILAVVPQGLLTMAFKLTGNQNVQVWFLAMYLPEPWGWFTSIAMTLIGGALICYTVLTIKRTGARGEDS